MIAESGLRGTGKGLSQMGLLDRFRRRPLEQDGRSAETAILMPRVDAGEAAAIRYRVLERLFGTRDLDWQIFKRSRSAGPRGRAIERFDIGTRQGNDIVFFDVSDVVESAEIGEAKAALSQAADGASEADLSIVLPPPLYLTLWKIIEEMADPFASDGFAYDFIRVTVLQAMAAHDLRSGAPLEVMLRVADWKALQLIAGLVDSADPDARERIAALGGAIGASLSQAGAAEGGGPAE